MTPHIYSVFYYPKENKNNLKQFFLKTDLANITFAFMSFSLDKSSTRH